MQVRRTHARMRISRTQARTAPAHPALASARLHHARARPFSSRGERERPGRAAWAAALPGAEPKTRRRGLKLPATAHGGAAGHGTRAGQSRNGMFLNKQREVS